MNILEFVESKINSSSKFSISAILKPLSKMVYTASIINSECCSLVKSTSFGLFSIIFSIIDFIYSLILMKSIGHKL